MSVMVPGIFFHRTAIRLVILLSDQFSEPCCSSICVDSWPQSLQQRSGRRIPKTHLCFLECFVRGCQHLSDLLGRCSNSSRATPSLPKGLTISLQKLTVSKDLLQTFLIFSVFLLYFLSGSALCLGAFFTNQWLLLPGRCPIPELTKHGLPLTNMD